jgi:polar amino acid transport system permease protein
MNVLLANLGFIGKGLWMTLSLSVLSLVAATLAGCLLGMLGVAASVPLRWSARSVIELFRGLPLIVNVFFVFFGLPILGVELAPFVAIVISLTVWGGGNIAEIVRGGLNAVPAHQLKSAVALGMQPWQVMCVVQAPQAVRSILPAYVGMATQVVQATSLGALIGVTEFLRVGQGIVERMTVMDGWNPAFAVYAGVLLVYFLICSVFSACGRHLERRAARGYRTGREPQARESAPIEALAGPPPLRS